MKITKEKDHVLFKNSKGSYHLSLKEFESLGELEAIEFAEKEIDKKLEKGQYPYDTINFQEARNLGFCEYGIKDFCNRLKLDLDKTYKIKDLNKMLTIDILKEYTDECIKLFGNDTLKYIGGVKGVLDVDTIDLLLKPEFIPEIILHKLSVKFAYSCLDNFEKEYPDDKRPREAIETKEAWIRGDITDEQLSAARSAARSAAWSAAESVESAESAARSAAWSAESAAESATWSAARSARSAAWSAESAAESATWSAARSAAQKRQVLMILEELGEVKE